MREREERQIEEWKEEIRSRVGDEEFLLLEQKVISRDYGSLWMNWLALRDCIRQRTEEEMPEAADLVFAWLQAWEGEPPTHWELHRACGDGLTAKEVADALHWLQARELAELCAARPCAVSGAPSCATWRVADAFRSQQSAG